MDTQVLRVCDTHGKSSKCNLIEPVVDIHSTPLIFRSSRLLYENTVFYCLWGTVAAPVQVRITNPRRTIDRSLCIRNNGHLLAIKELVLLCLLLIPLDMPSSFGFLAHPHRHEGRSITGIANRK